MKTIQNQKGFSAVEAIIILIVVAILGFAGWYVWHKNHAKSSSKTPAASQDNSKNSDSKTTAKKTYELPAGYKMYENQDLGFRFAYPEVYGDLTSQPDENGVKILKSSHPIQPYGAGITGSFSVFTYGSADQALTGRKYGPQIKLQNGKWIVTEANDSDVIDNKVGDEYKDFEKKTVASKTNDGLNVYLLKSGDEGSESDRLVFVAKNMLHVIQLPNFSDGLYGGGTANDKAEFNTLLQSVWDSIALK